jgi:O-antigen/teichoic acid export membrane protein
VVAFVVLRPRRRPEVRSRALLQQGVWLAVAGTANVLMWRQGTLVSGGLGSIGLLATYVVATRFLDAGVTVAHTAGFGLLPGLSALAADRPAFRASALHYLRLTALGGLAIAVLGVLLAGPATTIPFGEQWADAVPAVRWVAVSALPILLAYVMFTVLLARGQVRTLGLSTVAGAITGTVSSVLLMRASPDPVDGVIGTLVGATVTVAVMAFALRDLLRPLDPTTSSDLPVSAPSVPAPSGAPDTEEAR